MHLTEQQELLIQRCVDDELSVEETRRLLNRMDHVDEGWKSLACGFLEDRLLKRSICRIAADVVPSEPVAVAAAGGRLTVTGSASAVPGSRNWFGHPLTSLSLCAAIAFVSGLLIPKSPLGTTPSHSPTVAQGSTADVNPGTASLNSMTAQNGVHSAVPRYHVEWQQNGRGSQVPVQVPVYQEVDDSAHELADDRQLFGSDGREFLMGGNNPATRLLRIPVNDSEDILLFVREQDLGLPLQ